MSKFIPFSSDVMFCEVMKHNDICKELIERIIGRSLKEIKYCNQQETITSGTQTRGIRLDVCVEDMDGTIIDVEMQIGHYDNLPLRFRGYQSILDSSYWKRGDDFSDLKETYIIFLCLGDSFKQSKAEYTLTPTCKECPDLEIDFKVHWIVLSANAFEQAPVLVGNLLKYMKTNKSTEDALVQKIHKVVTEANEDPEKVMQMTTVQDRYNEFQRIIDSLKVQNAQDLKSKDKEIKSKDKEIEYLKNRLSKYETIEK